MWRRQHRVSMLHCWPKQSTTYPLDLAENHFLPELTLNDARREIILPGAKTGKNPDLRINGIYVEVKEPILPYGKNTINHAIQNGHNHANFIIINILDETVSEYDLFRVANDKPPRSMYSNYTQECLN